jgi:hypothetical protein
MSQLGLQEAELLAKQFLQDEIIPSSYLFLASLLLTVYHRGVMHGIDALSRNLEKNAK